jgi:amino acid transporter
LFWLQVAYLVALFALAIAYVESADLRRHLPTALGPLPVTAPWFGAIGAVLISLTGIFLHSRNWDPSYELWHITRPLVGAIIGPIGCLILVVIVSAANKTGQTPNRAFYDVVAFLVGYREETFRALIKRGTDVILGSERPPAASRKPSSPAPTMNGAQDDR